MPLTKNKFRENCLKQMKNLSNHNALYRNKKLNKQLQKELKKLKAKRVLFYYPLGFEADIRDTLIKVRKKSEVYIPFMQLQSFKMVPFRLPLKKKKFGIYEAGNTIKNINKIDVAIVPTVGVDGNLQRVGFGKGMYDRFFARLKKRPYIIFIQPSLCQTKDLVCDDYDIGCDLLLTPTKRVETNSRVKRGR